MHCKHQRQLNLSSITIQCPHCKDIVSRNRIKLDRGLKGRSGELRETFIKLVESAGPVKVLGAGKKSPVGMLAVKNVSAFIAENSDRKADMLILEEDKDPTLIHWDHPRNVCFVFDPRKKSQNWGTVEKSGWKFQSKMGRHSQVKSADDLDVKVKREVIDVPVELITPFIKGQSRSEHNPGFTHQALADLAETIDKDGQFATIVVQKLAKPYQGFKYQIVAGERRWRASKIAGQKTIRCEVLPPNVSEAELMKIILGDLLLWKSPSRLKEPKKNSVGQLRTMPDWRVSKL